METIGLCLVDAQNQYQQLLRREAEEAARTAGFDLETRFCEGDFASQLGILSRWLEADSRPVALLAMAVRARRRCDRGRRTPRAPRCERALPRG